MKAVSLAIVNTLIWFINTRVVGNDQRGNQLARTEFYDLFVHNLANILVAMNIAKDLRKGFIFFLNLYLLETIESTANTIGQIRPFLSESIF